MKTLSYALVAASLLVAAPALAGEGSFGQNQFHGADNMASYAAKPQAPGAAQRQVAAVQAPIQTRAQASQVWGEAAVDPIYFNLSAQAPVRAAAPAAQAADTAEAIDFGLAYAD